MRDADRLLESEVQEQDTTGFWRPVMYLYMYLHSPVFHLPQRLPLSSFPTRLSIGTSVQCAIHVFLRITESLSKRIW